MWSLSEQYLLLCPFVPEPPPLLYKTPGVDVSRPSGLVKAEREVLRDDMASGKAGTT